YVEPDPPLAFWRVEARGRPPYHAPLRALGDERPEFFRALVRHYETMTDTPTRVSIHDRTGDVLIWAKPYPIRRVNGGWYTGETALKNLPSADELKDDWSPAIGPVASQLIAQARAELGDDD